MLKYNGILIFVFLRQYTTSSGSSGSARMSTLEVDLKHNQILALTLRILNKGTRMPHFKMMWPGIMI